ncbi:cobalt ECF transporter T component CbiQ [Parageobacillus toebii NBRC 107807]|uniref:Cobalt/nickel transport system permease protein n=1 Tax=Parageobacillus toebii NBRC 107807 TaxID=1223503 RepID=A0A6G9J681_9BACL|nr:cobalt ECF transporter T component CbiQ [Parageobacillus toebii]MBB3869050.1 cobalt/nickel transport system permease protein [Parageobacillus toebii NBRC 107807]QIQ33460.1 cobalt ECF transporter T component CbiQ [Parageobacillus toebii NBRC 107807]
MIRQFDTIAYDNRLRTIRPEQKVIFALLLLMMAITGNWKMQVMMTIWLAIWIIGYARVSWKVYAKALGVVALFLMMSFPALLVSIDKSFHVSIDRSQIFIAMSLLSRSVAAWSCLFFLLVTTPFPEILYVLKRMKVPSIIIELLFFMYRFVFVFEKAAEELYVAMKARNGGNHWRHGGMLVFQLFQKIWHSYEVLRLALWARGVSDEMTYVHVETYNEKNKRYLWEAAIGICLLLRLG